MENSSDSLVIFRKNAREAVGVACTEWRGQLRVDVRIYAQAIGEDDLVPTRKGISIPPDIFPAVLEAVRKLGEVMARERLIARIPRNHNTEIRIGVNEFRGQRLIYLRLFLREDSQGEETWKPTQKGVSLRVDLYPRLLDALEKANAILAATECNSRG